MAQSKSFFGKHSQIVAIITIVTLVLQLLILFRTSCDVGVGGIKIKYVEAPLPNIPLINRSHLLVQTPQQKPQPASLYVPAPRPALKRRLTIGIPTVMRRDGSYFLRMLNTMINRTTTEQLNDIVFVVMLAENNNITWRVNTEKYLKHSYSKLIDKGALRITQAPLSFYDSMETFSNNSYMTWRTKQNFDYAYIMQYSQYLSEYYMQMEDDVYTADNYYPLILEYIQSQQDDKWVCLEFSELGYIGKLYHSRDLKRLADMFLMFNNSQPVDYTFIYFNVLAGQSYRLLRKPTLFQHMGIKSSLVNKIQPLRDKFFDFPKKTLHGDNPPAKCFTTLKTNQDFPPQLAYSKENGHFWSDGSAALGDTFTIVFDTPQTLTGVVIVTGGRDHPDDKINHAVIETSPVLINREEGTCDSYVTVGEFQNGTANITTDTLKAKMPFKTTCLKLRFTQAQINWVIIKEIAVFHA